MGIIDETPLSLRIADIFLRFIIIFLNIADIWLVVTNQQDDSIYGKLVFSNLMGLKYMVCINAIGIGYGCLAAVCLWIRCLTSYTLRIFFVSDQMMAYLMITSAASLVEIIYLAFKGDQKVTWSEACNIYATFCNRLKVAMALHVISLCCLCLIAMVSAYRFFSRFDPPFVAPDERTDIEPK